jgi:hypothetical protein
MHPLQRFTHPPATKDPASLPAPAESRQGGCTLHHCAGGSEDSGGGSGFSPKSDELLTTNCQITSKNSSAIAQYSSSAINVQLIRVLGRSNSAVRGCEVHSCNTTFAQRKAETNPIRPLPVGAYVAPGIKPAHGPIFGAVLAAAFILSVGLALSFVIALLMELAR